jgi:serine phosphatase RsbU (regulator of sigma subunit)
MEPEDQLTIVSDGVLEAENEAGELFGFERTRTQSQKSAMEIAQAALAWGQTDDITVVRVRRNG